MPNSRLMMTLIFVAAIILPSWFLLSGRLTEKGLPNGVQSDANNSGNISSQVSEQLVYEKAVLGCILAATYGAERSVKIVQAEALLESVVRSDQPLTPVQTREIERIRALLPDNKRERDASYALYFEGVSALAEADPAKAEQALKAIEADFRRSGLSRLVRYFVPIRTQIQKARQTGPSSTNFPKLINDLEASVKRQ
jgi:hypothetical protein